MGALLSKQHHHLASPTLVHEHAEVEMLSGPRSLSPLVVSQQLQQQCKREEDDEHSEASTASPSSVSSHRSSEREAPPNTVIVFDWDDTLLCSTALNRMSFDSRQLEDLERAVESVLRTAMSLGETWIVTNGNKTWVKDSATRCMPRLLPLLAELGDAVVSARALYERSYPGNPFMWKKAAFEHLLVDSRSSPPGQDLNLIVLGDQYPEIEAAQHVGRVVGGSPLVKTVKFKEGPSCSELLGQLSRAECDLRSLVMDENSRGYQMLQKCRRQVTKSSSWGCYEKEKEESRWRPFCLKDIWPFLS